MHSVMRILALAEKDVVEFLSLDSKNRVYWTHFGSHITTFNDESFAQEWADKLNRDFGGEVCFVSFGPDSCDA